MSHGIETINILTSALCKTSALYIVRMDIEYNTISELYKARVWLGDLDDLTIYYIFDISEDGEIHKVERTVIS